ncbi:restriction endonuclease subunit S [Sutcliffiella horikoshii]|uniref:restriction endonuclease subunit S n=1 Tax=Sutcliffiella horikoshii TaxID=79883 RepID=UPI003CED6F58
MKSNFETKNFKNFIEQIRGVSYKKHQISETPKQGYIPLIRATNIQKGKLVFEDLIYVDETIVKEEQKVQINDIIIVTSSGSKHIVGKSAQVEINSNCTFGAFCKLIRIKNKEIHPQFLKYFLKTSYYSRTISESVNGANINNIKNEHINNLSIPLPSLNVQMKIVQVLNLSEALIDKRKAQVSEVSKLMQSVFLDMFGDPIVNMKNWEVQKLEEICTVVRGGSPRPIENYLGGTVPWIKIGDASKGENIYLNTTKEKIKVDGVKKSRLIPSGSLIFANCGVSLGFARIITFDGCIHDGWLAFENINKKIDKVFLLKLLNFYTNYFRETAPDGTQPNLNTKIMKGFGVIIPPIELQKKYVELVFKLEEQKLMLEKSLLQLENSIQTLIQQAFSGILFREYSFEVG